MTSSCLVVSVVDDDQSIRESLPDLLRAFAFEAHAFASAEEFLASAQLGETACLILDITMPGMTGPQLMSELKGRGHDIPIVFITARADEAIRRRLVTEGAVACLPKPFSEAAVIGAVHAALGRR